jgi:AcrR family transcriptional regulator
MQKNSSVTSYRQQLREKILKISMEEFKSKGIRAVKMDDIAALLGISKRTLYEIYSNKEELLLECVKFQEGQYDAYMASFEKDPSNNVIDIIIEFYNKQIQWLSDVNPLYFSDIQKYSQVVSYFERRDIERKQDKMIFYQRGIREGVFRDDVDYDVLSRILKASIDYIKQTQMYKEYDLTRILNNIIMLFIRGVCTYDGIKQFDALMSSCL